MKVPYTNVFKSIWHLLRETFLEFLDNNSFDRGAALAYYTIFALCPLLIIIISLAGIFFGREAVQGKIYWQLNGLVRPAVVTDATRDYFDDQDVFGQWIEENTERNATATESNSRLFASWRRYAEAAGERAGSTKAFGEMMRKRGLEPYRTKHARGFTGVRLLTDGPLDDPRFPDQW